MSSLPELNVQPILGKFPVAYVPVFDTPRQDLIEPKRLDFRRSAGHIFDETMRGILINKYHADVPVQEIVMKRSADQT